VQLGNWEGDNEISGMQMWNQGVPADVFAINNAQWTLFEDPNVGIPT